MAELDPNSPYGIDFMGDSLDTFPERIPVAAQQLRFAGVRFARITAYWYLMEQDTAGPGLAWWEQNKLAAKVNALLDAGITPYITLEATSCRARSAGRMPCDTAKNPIPVNYHPPDAAHPDAWATYVQEMVQAFPQVHYWGIWNEPNGTFLFPDTGTRLSNYVQLVKSAAPIIHAAGGVVIAPDLATGYTDSTTGLSELPWLQSFLSQAGTYVDIVTVHLYADTTADGFDNAMRAVANVSGSKELWLTEVDAPGNVVDDITQAKVLAAVYRARNATLVSTWKKVFFFNAGIYDSTFKTGIIKNIGSDNYIPRPAYDSLKKIANPTTPPYISGPNDVSTLSGCNNRYDAKLGTGDDAVVSTWSTDGQILWTTTSSAAIAWSGSGGGHYVRATVDGGTLVQLNDIVASPDGMSCQNY